MLGFVGNAVGAGAGVVLTNAMIRLEAPLYEAEGTWSRWPRYAVMASMVVGGLAIRSKVKADSFGYFVSEGLALSGMTQILQQVYGRFFQ